MIERIAAELRYMHTW